MKTQKILFSVIIFALALGLVAPVFAADTASTYKPVVAVAKGKAANTKLTADQLAALKASKAKYAAAVKAADKAYADAIRTANSDYKTSIKAANDAYKTAVKAAGNDKTKIADVKKARKDAVKVATDKLKADKKSALDARKKAKADALAVYKAEVKSILGK